MLLEKYAPKSPKEIAGNSFQIAEIGKFLSGWKKGKALLIHGATGTAKTAALKLTAKNLGYEIVEANGSDKRSVADYYEPSVQQSLFTKKKMLLFEDLETMPMRGFPELVARSEHPVVCIICDAYQLNPAVRKLFKMVKFEKISEPELLRFAENVCRNENIALSRRALEQLVKTSNGDVRAMLIDLEFESGRGGYRDTEDTIFNTLRIIFKTMSLQNSKIAVDNCEKEPEELMRWLEENISEEYTDPMTIAIAFDYLSRADVFRSRIIRRQSWSLQKYLHMAAYGATLAKSRPSARFASYKFPAFGKRNGVMLEKLSKSLHISMRRAPVYIPILRILAKNNSNILDELGIDEKWIS